MKSSNGLRATLFFKKFKYVLILSQNYGERDSEHFAEVHSSQCCVETRSLEGMAQLRLREPCLGLGFCGGTLHRLVFLGGAPEELSNTEAGPRGGGDTPF